MLSVARLKRVGTGAFKARKAVPEDIREAYSLVYGQKWEAIFWAPAGTPPGRAKLLHVEWLASHLRSDLATIRAVVDRDGGRSGGRRTGGGTDDGGSTDATAGWGPGRPSGTVGNPDHGTGRPPRPQARRNRLDVDTVRKIIDAEIGQSRKLAMTNLSRVSSEHGLNLRACRLLEADLKASARVERFGS
jgi:hypothetical protein